MLLLTSCSPAPAPSGETTVVTTARTGEAIYKKYCFNCHQGGIPDSPVFGKVEDWEDRVEKGRDALLESVREGISPGMPKMGTCKNCTDEELGNVVDYMLAALEENEDKEAESE